MPAGSSLLWGLFCSHGEQGLLASCEEVQASLAVASLVAEHGLEGTRASVITARGLSGCSSRAQSTGSAVMARGLTCCTACGIFLDQGFNQCPCNGRQILNLWATREFLYTVLFTCNQFWQFLSLNWNIFPICIQLLMHLGVNLSFSIVFYLSYFLYALSLVLPFLGFSALVFRSLLCYLVSYVLFHYCFRNHSRDYDKHPHL